MGWGADNPPGGPLTAPAARRVDMFSGDVAPTKYFQALSEADELVRELDGLRELQTRVDELAAERDDLIEQLRELDEAHQITLGLLATANAQLKRMQATR